MILTDEQYHSIKTMIRRKRSRLVERRRELKAMGLSAKRIERGVQDMASFCSGLAGDVAIYERTKKRVTSLRWILAIWGGC